MSVLVLCIYRQPCYALSVFVTREYLSLFPFSVSPKMSSGAQKMNLTRRPRYRRKCVRERQT
jgi:hypothetical protein